MIGYSNKDYLSLYPTIVEVYMMYYVKLIKGQSFYAFDHRFLLHQEEEVTQKIFKYLCKNEFFEARKGENCLVEEKEKGKKKNQPKIG